MTLRLLSQVGRILRHQKIYIAIIIIGLSLALGASLLTLSFINYELSYEKCHENANNIYRIGGQWIKDDFSLFLASVMHPLGNTMKDVLPEVENQARIRCFEDVSTKTEYNRKFNVPKFLLADSDILSIFTIPLLYGDPELVLKQPFSLVISEKIAKAYFGESYPVGKTITIRDSINFTISGVMKDLPHNTLIHTDFLASYSSLELIGEDLFTWNNTRNLDAFTYILLKDGALPIDVNDKIRSILASNIGEEAVYYNLKLEPILDLHLNPDYEEGLASKGSMYSVTIFAGISLLLILMACFNYINLSTARIFHRTRELLVRTVAGANQKQLFVQFLSEAILLTSFAMILGLVFYEIIIPYLETYLGRNLDVSLSNNTFVWMAVPILILVVGVLSGTYPAYKLLRSRSKGLSLNRQNCGSRKSKLRRILVVSQAVISISLVGFTMGVLKQINYASDIDLGFDSENVVLLDFDKQATFDQKELFKQELSNIGLAKTSLVQSAPGESFLQFTAVHSSTEEGKKDEYLATFKGDNDFGETFNLRLIQGKQLSDKSISNLQGSVLLNEKAVKILNLNDPIGAELNSSRGQLKVVGVVKDFHALSLHNKVFPCVIFPQYGICRSLAVCLPEDEQTHIMTIGKIQDVWAKVFPSSILEYRLLTDVMSKSYLEERKLMSLFTISSGISVFIACLGLLGLAIFVVERRIKEIGIRKSIGASVSSIVKLLTGEFVWLILIAGLIAWPITNYTISRWLEGFEYRTNFGFLSFISVVLIILMISLSTIGLQVIKAAKSNPSDILRSE